MVRLRRAVGALFLERLWRVDPAHVMHREVTKGTVFHPGDAACVLSIVHSGSFKLVSVPMMTTERQIAAFAIAGEPIPVEGFAVGECAYDAVALEDSDVCSMALCCGLRPADGEADAISPWFDVLHRQAVVRYAKLTAIHGMATSQERMASFLVDLRLRSGQACSESLALPMTHAEIGAYLQMAPRAVSGALRRLRTMRLIDLDRHSVQILDLQGLSEISQYHMPYDTYADNIAAIRPAAGEVK